MSNVRRRIILVDDDPSCRQQGKAILKDQYAVYPLPSAHKLFEVLEVFMPDLILLDIQMPVIDGYRTMKRLKSDERYAHIPVIFLTASNDKDSVIKGKEHGAVGFVTKPFSAADLCSHIEKCLNAIGRSDTADDEDIVDGKPVILAIDDAPDVLKSVHAVLRDKYRVYTLPKPGKLHEILLKTKPDLFLLDYQMPAMSGFEIIPIIREYPEHRNTPIIFMTSAGTVDHLTAAVGLGVCDFIVKPVDMDVLREKVASHIDHPKKQE
jgi:DNA-binding response OmpR family regulator